MSLKNIAVGKVLLIFFRRTEQGYSIAEASNSVQDARIGLFAGRIVAQEEMADSHGVAQHGLKFEVEENIYGWIGKENSSATLRLAPDHTCVKISDSERRETLDMKHAYAEGNYSDRELIVAFDETGACGLMRSSDEFLESLHRSRLERHILRP